MLKTGQGMVGLLIDELTDLVRFEKTERVTEKIPELNGYHAFFPKTAEADQKYYLADVEGIIEHTLEAV